jgi:hypothetical protein
MPSPPGGGQVQVMYFVDQDQVHLRRGVLVIGPSCPE